MEIWHIYAFPETLAELIPCLSLLINSGNKLTFYCKIKHVTTNCGRPTAKLTS